MVAAGIGAGRQFAMPHRPRDLRAGGGGQRQRADQGQQNRLHSEYHCVALFCQNVAAPPARIVNGASAAIASIPPPGGG